mmetsp:Transcript_3792/g.14402  ORF Transcript_3792/g.14402 Transcript_3792/m.14402 type:complete len:677 (+) Transcript_3792:22-2052(+)
MTFSPHPAVLLCLVLSLIPLILAASKKNGPYPLKDLPDKFYKGTSEISFYSGYLNKDTNPQFTSKNDHLFFVYFPHPDETKPLIIFLNGGPGCSSMVSFAMEVGPIAMDPESGLLQDTPYGWHTHYSLLFVDNPAKTGYSFGDTDVKSASQAMKILDELLIDEFQGKMFPDAFKNGVFVVGESYGGKFAVELALNDKKMSKYIKGIGLGDAWIAPALQESSYGDYGYDLGLLNYRSLLEANMLRDTCVAFVEEGWFDEAQKKGCLSELTVVLSSGGGFNPYDMREVGSYKFLDKLRKLFKDEEFANALGASNYGKRPDGNAFSFSLCNQNVWDNFMDDFQKSYLHDIPKVLEDKKVLVYNGQFDIRCSVVGTNEWLRLMPWKHRTAWNSLEQSVFLVNSTTKGIFKEHDNLTQLVIYNAGHLAPFNQKEVSLHMIQKFVDGQSFCAGQRPAGMTCATVGCPNTCSEHGTCDGTSCKCSKHYSTSDCSTYDNVLEFGRKQLFSGHIFGRDFHMYKLDIGEFGNNMFDAQLILEKQGLDSGLKLGKLHVYLHTGQEYLEPNPEKSIVDQYPYRSLVDAHQAKLFVNELNRANISKLTVIVENTVDTEARYTLEIATLVSGPKPDGTMIAMISATSLLGLVMAALFVVCSLQWIYFRTSLNRNKKSRSASVPLASAGYR